jgi:penicillin-binding protein-related factor A (putative recombinase)
MYDWILFMFKNGKSTYLVPCESLEDAWEELRRRQSIGMDILKKEYEYIGCLNGDSRIKKIK